MIESLNYDLALIEIPVTIGDKKFILREAMEDAACQYQNALFHGMILGESGKPVKIRNMADTEPLLVSLCLFDAELNTNVSLETVKALPSRIVKDLFNKAKEISGIDEADTRESLRDEQEALNKRIKALDDAAAKKVPSITTDGSD